MSSNLRLAAAVLAAFTLPAAAAAQVRTDDAEPVAESRLPTGDSVALRTQLTAWDRAGEPLRIESDPEPAFHLQKPLASGYLSSTFGMRSDPMTGQARAHWGLDIAAPLGTPIYASEDGRVSFASVAGGYGRMVQINHRDGVQTRYGHLSQILIRPGAWIRRGEAIGLVGSTGRSTGSHLHFEVRVDGRPVDPSRRLTIVADEQVPQAPAPLLPVALHWQGLKISPEHLPSAF